MTGTSDFANPPIVELVFNAQFSPLIKLSAGHFGLFWRELGDAWTYPSDAPTIPDQFELFDRPRVAGFRFQLVPATLPQRFTLGHERKDRQIQIQSTRFCLNWRKGDQSYPSYTTLIDEFDKIFRRFTEFADRNGIGPVTVNQWELTYIDAFPKGEYWDTPADWTTFLPGLFHELFQTDDMEIALESRQAAWSYEIKPKRGRLHISAATGRVEGDERETVLLTTTVRGPVGKDGSESLRAGLDLGHGIAFEAFLRITSSQAKKRWEKNP